MANKKCVLDGDRLKELVEMLRLLNSKMQKHGYMYMLDPDISYNRVVIIRVAMSNYTETKAFHGNYTGSKNWFKGAIEIAQLL